MKYISYKVTCGGDAGFRLSNSSEWQSSEGQLLFDSSLWSMESIAKAIRDLYKQIAKREPWCHTYSSISKNGHNIIDPFIANTDGVYVDQQFIANNFCHLGFDVPKEKRITPTETDEVISWELDGNTTNYYYYRDKEQ